MTSGATSKTQISRDLQAKDPSDEFETSDPSSFVAKMTTHYGATKSLWPSLTLLWPTSEREVLEKQLELSKLIHDSVSGSDLLSGRQRLLVSGLEKALREKRLQNLQYPLMRFDPQLEAHYFADQLHVHTENVAQEPTRGPKNTVFISTLLIRGAILTATACIFSLAILFLVEVPFIHPFVAILVLVACPFFYAMGIKTKNDELKEFNSGAGAPYK
jgi:hypothetical protein